MKKYKFLIKKMTKTEVDIYAKNSGEALFELVKQIVMMDNEFLKEEPKEQKELYINVPKIIDENGIENLKDREEFIKENSFVFKPANRKNFEKDKEEIEDDFPKEYLELVCEKCGNCIPIDEIMHQLES